VASGTSTQGNNNPYQEHLSKLRLIHIIDGEYSRTDQKITGGHAEISLNQGLTVTQRKLEGGKTWTPAETKLKIPDDAIYEAMIRRNNIEKSSTMFPINWGRKKLEYELGGAYNNFFKLNKEGKFNFVSKVIANGLEFFTTTPSGITVKGYLDKKDAEAAVKGGREKVGEIVLHKVNFHPVKKDKASNGIVI
jgi:hypothetical protein